MPRQEAWELALTETLPGPPERVFALMADPGELERWWGPHGFVSTVVEWDLRAGGRFRLSMAPPAGEPFGLTGIFGEIDPPKRLSYSFRWEEPAPDDRETQVAVTLVVLGEGTQVSVTQGPFATEERLALHRNGWTESLQRLRARLPDESWSG